MKTIKNILALSLLIGTIACAQSNEDTTVVSKYNAEAIQSLPFGSDVVVKNQVVKIKKATKSTPDTNRVIEQEAPDKIPKPVIRRKIRDSLTKNANQLLIDSSKTTIEEIIEIPLEELVLKPTGMDHSAFDAILRKYVNGSGMVNYSGLKKDASSLDAYIETLKQAAPEAFTKNNQIAFWANTYNAFTLKLIIDNYPLKSITDLKFGGKSAWDYKWIKLQQGTLSLNDLENNILRPKYKDPRIHFIINCASFSCPLLVNRALTGDNVQSIMTQQAKAFVNDTKRNKISRDKAKVSNLFEWYAADFGDLVTFLNKYSEVQINPDVTPSIMAYDWSLNKQ